MFQKHLQQFETVQIKLKRIRAKSSYLFVQNQFSNSFSIKQFFFKFVFIFHTIFIDLIKISFEFPFSFSFSFSKEVRQLFILHLDDCFGLIALLFGVDAAIAGIFLWAALEQDVMVAVGEHMTMAGVIDSTNLWLELLHMPVELILLLLLLILMLMVAMDHLSMMCNLRMTPLVACLAKPLAN